MGKINQPHDKYFKSTFGEVDFAKDFLENYLPKELTDLIEVDTIEAQPTTYITKELREQFTDLLFRVNIDNKEGYVYFLFEHKSYPDRMVIFQVLKYMIEVWEAKIKEDLAKRKEDGIVNIMDIEIPLVIPLVIYHDKHRWNIKRTLGEMMPNYNEFSENIKKYIPDFEYILSDLSNSKEGQNLEEEHSIVIRTLDKARYATKSEIMDMFTEAITIFTKNKEIDMVEHYIVETVMYILNARSDLSEKELFEIAGKISKEGGELVMSVAEKLRQEGMQEGKQEGIREGERIAIRRILLKRFKMSDVEINSELDKIEDGVILESLFNEALQVKTLDEFKTILENMK